MSFDVKSSVSEVMYVYFLLLYFPPALSVFHGSLYFSVFLSQFACLLFFGLGLLRFPCSLRLCFFPHSGLHLIYLGKVEPL